MLGASILYAMCSSKECIYYRGTIAFRVHKIAHGSRLHCVGRSTSVAGFSSTYGPTTVVLGLDRNQHRVEFKRVPVV